MNYRHAFHAGSFADVFKHAVLALIIAYLKEKAAAFRVIDTHAGPGRYDLTGPEAAKTGEWREGIGRLLAGPLDPALQPLLAPYLETVARFNYGGALQAYPGSPLLALSLLRSQDRMTACELTPAPFTALRQALAGDRHATALEMDGWQALSALLPPPERRGLVLIDPPYEAADEMHNLPEAIGKATRKWATGTYLVWYPIKQRRDADQLARSLRALRLEKALRAELFVADPARSARLSGSGLIVINPPWRLHEQLTVLLPALTRALSRTEHAPPPAHRLEWIAAGK
jgi:23S rRNA (adenine2030-N6)-methyltransferase